MAAVNFETAKNTTPGTWVTSNQVSKLSQYVASNFHHVFMAGGGLQGLQREFTDSLSAEHLLRERASECMYDTRHYTENYLILAKISDCVYRHSGILPGTKLF